MANKLVLVDTSILIDFFRKSDKANSRLIKLVRSGRGYCISVITEFEIYTGTSPDQALYWEEFLVKTPVLPFDKEIARVAVRINKILRQQSSQIGMADLFIAATASYHQLPFATLNYKHFQRIKELEILIEP